MINIKKSTPPLSCSQLTCLLLTSGTSVHNSAHMTKYAKQNIFKASSKHSYSTFIGPCIKIYFYSKPNQMHQCRRFILLEHGLDWAGPG